MKQKFFTPFPTVVVTRSDLFNFVMALRPWWYLGIIEVSRSLVSGKNNEKVKISVGHGDGASPVCIYASVTVIICLVVVVIGPSPRFPDCLVQYRFEADLPGDPTISAA